MEKKKIDLSEIKKLFELVSNISKRLNASAVLPANPAKTLSSLPILRILVAFPFKTVFPNVTCPSPPITEAFLPL